MERMDWDGSSISTAELCKRWDTAERNINIKIGEITARYRRSTLGDSGKKQEC